MFKNYKMVANVSLVAMLVSLLFQTVNAAPVSHSVTDDSITVDANLDDWEGIASFGYDANTLANVNVKADFLEGWMAHDSENLYLAYRNNGDIDTSAWWAWQVYFDTDGSDTTGYRGVSSVGAEYLLQGSGLYQYTGSGNEWSWQYVETANNEVDGAIAEFKILRDKLGDPETFSAVFKTRNGVFTGDYSAAGIDTYPRTLSALPMHNELLFRQSAIWTEPSSILSMVLLNQADAGDLTLKMASNYPLIDGQLITYFASDNEYYTASIESISNGTITLKQPLQASIEAGQNVWNFYKDGSHPHEYGYRAIADFAIRQVGLDKLNTGRHVLLGDSWFGIPGIGERLAARLGNATIINKGVGGNTSLSLLNRFDADVPTENPDFVWVIAGVNDYHNDVPVSSFVTNMQAIIAKISNLGVEGVILDSPVGQLFYGSDERRQLSHGYAAGLASGSNGTVDYEFGAAPPPSETGVVSNPESITIDGDLSDWESLQSFGLDGDDISLRGARADYIEAWMAHDETNLYLAYRNDGEIDERTWWPWQTFLDTDNDESTGFEVGNGVGANYIIQGNNLFRYIGSGTDWSWQYLTSGTYKINVDRVELAIPRNTISNLQSLRAVMKARNGIFTGNYSLSGIDSYPNIGAGHFKYKLDEVPTDGPISNRVENRTIRLDGDLADWGSTTSFGTDPDEIADAAVQADWLEAWAAHDDNNLYFAYKNDGDISPISWPYQIYIDVDNDPSTGFKATNSIGADFLLEGPSLRRYRGAGNNWNWATLAVTGSGIAGSNAEIAIPLSVLGGVSEFRMILRANNQPFTGSFAADGIDFMPDNAATSADGYFSYVVR